MLGFNTVLLSPFWWVLIMRYKSRIGMKDNILDRFIIYVLQVRILLYLILRHTHTRRVSPRLGCTSLRRGQVPTDGPVLLCHCLVLGRVGSVTTDRYDNITPIYCIYIITPIIIQHTILVNSTPPAPGKKKKMAWTKVIIHLFFRLHLYQ